MKTGAKSRPCEGCGMPSPLLLPCGRFVFLWVMAGAVLTAAGGRAEGPEINILSTRPGKEGRGLGAKAAREIDCGPTNGLAFSPDGCLLYSLAGDEFIHVWDATTGRHID